METQQIATKVAQLENRVATLEDEHKIVKGEVKQVLTDIRTAVLARDNPFDNELAMPAPPVAISAAAHNQPEGESSDPLIECASTIALVRNNADVACCCCSAANASIHFCRSTPVISAVPPAVSASSIIRATSWAS